MGNGLVRILCFFCEWSTVTDTPITTLVNRADAVKEWGEDRVRVAEHCGHSYVDYPPSFEFYDFNRAGPGEECLTLEGLLCAYLPGGCAAREGTRAWPKPIPREWLKCPPKHEHAAFAPSHPRHPDT